VELNAGRIGGEPAHARLPGTRRHLVANSDSHTGRLAAYTMAPEHADGVLGNILCGNSHAVPDHLM